MINILLCDDDKALCKSFEADIREYFFGKNIEFNVKSIYTMDELEDNITGCDILFLDVIINEQNSINLIADSGKTLPCQTVIVTSYPGEIYNISHISPSWYIDKVKYKKEHLHSALDKCLENISKAQRSKIIVNCDKTKASFCTLQTAQRFPQKTKYRKLRNLAELIFSNAVDTMRSILTM